MADPETDAAIARRYPREWARANDPSRTGNSKRRHALRARYARDLKLDALREQGACCAKCGSYGKSEGIRGRICFYDGTLTEPGNLCTKFYARSDT